MKNKYKIVEVSELDVYYPSSNILVGQVGWFPFDEQPDNDGWCEGQFTFDNPVNLYGNSIDHVFFMSVCVEEIK